MADYLLAYDIRTTSEQLNRAQNHQEKSVYFHCEIKNDKAALGSQQSSSVHSNMFYLVESQPT